MALRHSLLFGLLLLGLLSSELAWAQTDPPSAGPSPAPPPRTARAPRPALPARPPPPKAAKPPAPFVSQGLNFINAAATVSPHTWPGIILASALVAVLAR